MHKKCETVRYDTLWCPMKQARQFPEQGETAASSGHIQESTGKGLDLFM